MDVSYLIRLRLGSAPELVPDAPPPDPLEVDRICNELGWPEDYCAAWMAYAAGLPATDADGRKVTWTRRQIKGYLFIRHLYRTGRLAS